MAGSQGDGQMKGLRAQFQFTQGQGQLGKGASALKITFRRGIGGRHQKKSGRLNAMALAQEGLAGNFFYLTPVPKVAEQGESGLD